MRYIPPTLLSKDEIAYIGLDEAHKSIDDAREWYFKKDI